ncbi:MAG TPA: hypothetical protein VN253_02185, partial [Kofleriaceae bacterium]|nr:hypothetical protein [Kofleriaceae bacterium]
SQLALAGDGVAGAGVMVQGGPIDFGVVGCDAGGQSAAITLVNPAAIDAPFTARFPDDPELDHLRFSVTPAAGAVPAHGALVLQVRRNPLAPPASPRVHEAVLRIATSLGVETVTDVPVRDDVRSAFLQVSADDRAFGFVPSGQAVMLPIQVTNTGNAVATLRAAGAFQVLLPMPLPPGASGTAWAVYAPSATTPPSPVTGAVTLSTAGACQAPASLSFQGGVGPYADVLPRRVPLPAGCEVPPRVETPLIVRNLGNRPLHISCRETFPSELALQVSPDGLTVAPGASGAFVASLASGDVRGGELGEVSTFVDCVDDEPITNVKSTLVTREIAVDPAQLCFP